MAAKSTVLAACDEDVSFIAGTSVADDTAGEVSAVVGSSVDGISLVTGASVSVGATEVDSTTTGCSVAGETTGVSTGGGVVSSANTLIGKMSDNINEHKITTEKTVDFFVCFIVVTPAL
jgi:hypothetical protein